MSARLNPGEGMVIIEQGGQLFAARIAVQMIEWDRDEYPGLPWAARTKLTVTGALIEGRVWTPGEDLPFEQGALERSRERISE